MIPARVTGTRTVAAAVAAAAMGNLGAAALLILAFRAIGDAAFAADGAGGFVRGGVLLAAAFALEGAATALGGTAGAAASVRLRRSVLATTLRLDPDRSRAIGAGQALGIGLDLDLVGAFLVGSAPAALLGAAETAAGLVALGLGPSPVGSLLAAAVAIVLTACLFLVLLRHRAGWGRERGAITARLVERLVGQRTVTIQDDPAHTAVEGAARAARYRLASLRLDRTQTAITAIPLATLAVLVALLTVGTHHTPGGTATGLGGALLTAAGLGLLAAGTSDAAAARDAHRNLRRLHRLTLDRPADAAERGRNGHHAGVQQERGQFDTGELLLLADSVTATYPGGGGLTTSTSLRITDGDTILLTGSSGSGKTTLVEILTGRRPATTGHVELGRGITIARVPQAGDDHVFHASLLFNVLCGRRWPAEPGDGRAAVALLTELGLGPLIARMPAGIGQPVGDGGWRLSSGERARISLARALITEPDIVVLDETTAALDPHTRDTLLAVARAHARAVVLIAHP